MVKVKVLRCPIYEIMFLRRILLRLARPGTQRDRSLMHPVTALCSHHPPTLQKLFMVSCWHAIAKAGPARRSRDTAKVAVFRLAPSLPCRRLYLHPRTRQCLPLVGVIALDCPSLQGREECGPKGCERGDACPSPKANKTREAGNKAKRPE